MRPLILFAFIVLAGTVQAQDLQKEINDQVWIPFIRSFGNHDADGFLAVHSRDVIRSSRDGKEIIGWETYLENQRAYSRQSKASGRSHSIELRFIERIAADGRAIETGIYKTSSVDKEGKARAGFGKFLVVLRKEAGIWKILVDTDASEGVGEKEFLAAKEM